MIEKTAHQPNTLYGACLCDEVTYQLILPLKLFQYCHCTRCQTLSGTSHTANIFIPSDQFFWLTGQEKTKLYKLPEASYFSCCFCLNCGSSMPWQMTDGRNHLVPAGSLKHLEDLPKQSIFWASRAVWCKSPEDLPHFDTLPNRKKAPK